MSVCTEQKDGYNTIGIEKRQKFTKMCIDIAYMSIITGNMQRLGIPVLLSGTLAATMTVAITTVAAIFNSIL